MADLPPHSHPLIVHGVVTNKPRYGRGDTIRGQLGDYLVTEALLGGMGEVYLCIDLDKRQRFALKTFQAKYLANRKLRDAFSQEVAIWIALEKHPNIVRCFLMERVDHYPFMMLEWIVGDPNYGADLRSWLQLGPPSLRNALEFTIHICQGLCHAQQKQPGIVHRDLKPENILISQQHIAKITDFGLAKIALTANLHVGWNQISHGGRQYMNTIGGTPAYMAPEQWLGSPVDGRTDIYAVGCILFELLTGSLPFRSNTRSGFRRQHLKEQIPVLPRYLKLPNTLNLIIKRCLAKHQGDRFATVDDLVSKLRFLYKQLFSEAPPKVELASGFHVEDYTNRAATYLNLSLYDQALEDLNHAIALNSNYAPAYANRSGVYLKLKRYEDALIDANRAIEIDDSNAISYGSRAGVYDGLERYHEALEDLSIALRLNPHLGILYAARGHILSKLQRFQEGLSDLSHSIRLDSTSVYARRCRGAYYTVIKEYDHALSDLSRAIDLDPIDAESYRYRGKVYFELGRYSEALKDLNRAIQLDPHNADAYRDRGATYERTERYDYALANYSRAVAIEPNRALNHYNLGVANEALKRYDEAMLNNNQAIHLDPEFAMAYNNRGKLFEHQLRLTEATADYDKASSLDPKLPLPYYNRGEVLLKLQRFEEALSQYSRCIELDPQYSRAYAGSGSAKFQLGRHDEALDDYNVALRIDPSLAIGFMHRAFLQATVHENFTTALEDLNQCLRLQPDLAIAYLIRSSIFLALNDEEKAIVDYLKATQLDSNMVQIALRHEH